MPDPQLYRQAERKLWDHFGLNPQERQLRMAGLGVRVQVVGQGPDVVLLHGSPNAGSTWAALLPWLAGFRCHVVDRPGTGLSDDFVLTQDLHGFARSFLPSLLDALELSSAHVVASSFGGFVGLMSAAASPQRVQRMVQMGCPAFIAGMSVPGFMKAMSLRPVRWLMNTLPPNDSVGRSIMRQIGHGASLDANRIPDIFFEWYLALQRHTRTMRNDGEMIGRAASLSGFPPALAIPVSTLRAVTAPTLFLWGADDPFGDESVAQRTVAQMPDARLRMLPASGHLPWLDDPRDIGQATAEFLSASA